MARMTSDEYNEKLKELLAELPVEFRNEVAYKAYEDGHAYGYEEVLIHLADLINLLKEPIEEYTARIKKELDKTTR